MYGVIVGCTRNGSTTDRVNSMDPNEIVISTKGERPSLPFPSFPLVEATLEWNRPPSPMDIVTLRVDVKTEKVVACSIDFNPISLVGRLMIQF